MNRKAVYNYLPILTVAAVLPLLVYVHMYSFSCDDIALLNSDETYSDLFSFGKSVLFGCVSLWMLWKIVTSRMTGSYDKDDSRNINRAFLSLLILGIIQIISVITAIDKKMAVFGGYYRFEGTYVLISYSILCYYTYKITKKYKKTHWIVIALCICSLIMDTVGIMQLFGKDPFLNRWIQRILLPFGDKGVIESVLKIPKAYMTLGNPNTASVYYSVIIPFIFASGIKYRGKIQILTTYTTVLNCILIVWTGSRVGILSLITAAIAGIIHQRKKIAGSFKAICLYALLFVIIIFVANYCMEISTISLFERIASSSIMNKSKDLLICETCEDGVHLKKSGKEYVLKFDIETDIYLSLKIFDNDGNDVSDNVFSYENGTFLTKEFDGVTIKGVQIDYEDFLAVKDEKEMYFTYDIYGGYLMYVGHDSYDKVTKPKSLNGYEEFASGRGYIWLRSLPLIKQYGLLGCGADNFVLAFPQNDYNGKSRYCESPITVVEKAHNAYLQIIIQNGIPALLLIVIFFIIFTKITIPDKDMIITGILMGTCAYAVGMFFNDSTVSVTSLLFMLIGIAFGEKSYSNSR